MNSTRIRALLFLILYCAGPEVFAQRFYSLVFDKLPRDMQLYARDESDSAEVAISGFIDVEGWDYISVMSFRNKEPYAYSKSILNYEGKATANFSLKSKIKAEMADYDFEVYAKKGSDSALIVKRTEVVAGDFYVINGQSNAAAVHFGDWSSKYCRTLARKPDSSPAFTEGDTLWIESAWSWPYAGAWGVQFQRMILENHGIPTCVINGALPGSKIEQHVDRVATDPTSPGLYGFLLDRVKIANPTKIKAFFWYQGEQEALENIQNYPEQFDKLYNFWQADYPEIEKFVIIQIPVLFMPYYVAGTIRDFQRRTKYHYPKTDHFSVMGLPYFDGIHYDIKGYQELGKRLYNFLGSDYYNIPFDANAACPDVKRVFYSSERKDEITLVFDEGQELRWPKDTLIEDVNFNFFTKSLREVFFFDGDESKPAGITEGLTEGNRVKLTLGSTSEALKLNYLPAYKGEKIRVYYGPFLTNTRGLGAFSFQNVAIADQLVISGLKAVENGLGTVDLSWNAIPGAEYSLFRKTEDESSFLKVAELDSTKLSYNDSDVVPGKLYTYRILAINSVSESMPTDVEIKTSPLLAIEGPDNGVWNLYPNPVVNKVEIQLRQGISGVIEIHNLRGQALYSKNVGANKVLEVEMTAWPAGEYIVSFKNDTGLFLSRKIIRP